MRSISLASMTALSLSVALAACSQGDVSKPTTGTGGTTSSGSGGTSASGGSTGTGGSATGTGGTSSGSGGTTVTGTGGTTATGGTTGAGGTTATGGAGGGSTGAAGGGSVSVKDIAGVPNQYGESLMSSLILMPCYQQAAQDCYTTPGGAC